MGPLTTDQRRQALNQFLERLDRLPSELKPDDPILPYDVCPRIEQVRWRIPFVQEMVRGELRELTNIINQWMALLKFWHAWLDVIDGYEAELAWGIQWEFIEPIVFKCMFQPSAARDRFTFVATNALHQARMVVDPTCPDHLEFDPPSKTKHPNRRQKEGRLKDILARWPAGKSVLNAIEQLDGKGHRELTRDFRNLSSHSIAPRISIGYTKLVTREVRPATTLEPVGDGTHKLVEIPDKYSVSYGFGGTPPLQMDSIIDANRAEFAKARHCFNEYTQLLESVLATLPDA